MCFVFSSVACRQVGHLSDAHLAFFARWDRTIDLEAKIGEQVNDTRKLLENLSGHPFAGVDGQSMQSREL